MLQKIQAILKKYLISGLKLIAGIREIIFLENLLKKG